ncbi:MAG: hypothetical protein J7495_07055 [Sphingomonas sp.]|nr:hypothetical protein [Sphingomonas sp.]
MGAAALLVLAGVPTIAQVAAHALDVQGNDRLARLFGGQTQQERLRISQAMAAGTGKPLPPATRALVRGAAVRDPLSADPYFLLGASRAAEGDRRSGAALVGLAVRRDPRFLPARYWQIDDDARGNRVERATAGVLRAIDLDPDNNQQTVPMLVRLTKVPASWPLIRAALPGASTWRDYYYEKLVAAQVEPSIVFNAIDAARAASGKAPAVQQQGALLQAMVAKGDFDRAYTAWLGWLPQEALGKIAYLYDGGFTGSPGALPFNWQMPTEGDGTAAIEPSHGLRFDYSPEANIALARQVALIPPGQYRLTSFSKLDQERESDTPASVSWQIACLPKGNVIANLALPNAIDLRGVATTFTVGADCTAQAVMLMGTSSEFPVRVGGYVRQVKIEKATK